MTQCAHQTASDTHMAQPAVIQRSCSCGAASETAAPCAACAADDKLQVQPKLAINPPGDRYEQEADRIADQVVAPRAVPLSSPLSITPLVQRQSAEDEEEQLQTSRDVQREAEDEEEETLQRHAAQTQPRPASRAFAQGLSAASHGGQALDKDTRASFEKRLGYDLSAVRYHDGENADRLNRQIGARAFTHGNHIFFARGQLDTRSASGRRLMAHEVVHTLQQARGATRRATQSSAANGAVQRDFPLEETSPDADAAVLTPDEIQAAIRFNDRRYDETSIRLIQDSVGSEVNGVMDEETVLMVADLQRGFGMTQDGKIGTDTFDLITRSKDAAADPTGRDDCITSFNISLVNGPQRTNGAVAGTINALAHFNMRARFEPRCNCADFEYRQFICGTVTITAPGGAPVDLAASFGRVPGGTLPACAGAPTVEDGDTALPAGTGPNYGHRNQGGDATDRFLPTRATGCEYRGFDIPGLSGVNVAANAGSTINFDMRFLGRIVRRQAGVFRQITQKQWRVTGNVVV